MTDVSLDDYAYLLCRGGWPQIMQFSKKNALHLACSFYDGLVNEDSNRVFRNKKNPERVRRVMRAYARAESTETSTDALTADIKENEGGTFDSRTTDSYINALKKLYVIEKMRQM